MLKYIICIPIGAAAGVGTYFFSRKKTRLMLGEALSAVATIGIVAIALALIKALCCANSIQIFDLGGDSNIPYSPHY